MGRDSKSKSKSFRRLLTPPHAETLKDARDYLLPHRRLVALIHRFIIHRVKDGDQLYMLVLAVLVGLIMGVATALFRYLIMESHKLFFGAENAAGGNLAAADPLHLLIRAALPAFGGLIVGLLIYRVLKLSGGHGVPNIIRAVATGHVNLAPGMAIKSSTSVITITSGGSCGPEGPMIEIGSVIGSIVGREAQVSKERIGTLMGCGSAAGIAAVFNAPVGGVFLAMELLMRDFTVRIFGPVVLSSVVAAVTSEALLKNEPLLPRLGDQILDSIHLTIPQFIMFILLGVITGAAGSLFVFALYRMHDMFQNWRIPLWIKPAIGGILVGVIGLWLPVLGEGYDFVREDIIRDFAPDGGGQIVLSAAALFIVIGLVKILATGLTLGSGGTGGAFAPAMVMGAMLGAGLGVICQRILPANSCPAIPVFALVGMAGTVCSALQIPIAGMMIIYEVSGANYRLILPLMLTVAASAFVANLFRQGSVYTLPLLRDGFDVDQVIQKERNPLKRVPVRKIMHADFVRVRENDNLRRMLDAFSQSEDDAFAVVDAEDHLLGMISTNDLRGVLNLGGVGEAIIAADAADTNPSVLYPESAASEAMAIFGSSTVTGIPVLARPGSKKIVGMVSRVDVLSAYKDIGGPET